MLSVNVTLDVASLGGGNNSCQPVMAGRNPRAKWAQLVQRQVKRHAFISKKWLNLVEEAKKYNVTLQILEAVGTTTSETSITPNQRISLVIAAHSASTPDQRNKKRQTLSSEKIQPRTVKLNSIDQYGKDESYQEGKRLRMVQQSTREEFFVKVLNFFTEIPVDAVALVILLIIFSIPFSIRIIEEILEEDSPEEAIRPEMVILVYLFVFFQHMEGSNHLRDGTNKQYLLLLVVLMNLSGVHAGESTHEGIKQIGSAADGNVWERRNYFEESAYTLALMAIGGVAWRMLRRPANPIFGAIDEALRNIPIPRRDNPDFVIHPALP